MKLAIRQLTPDEVANVRDAVADCRAYWPNAHLGDTPPRQDIRSAFKMIRDRVMGGVSIGSACADLRLDAARYVDM